MSLRNANLRNAFWVATCAFAVFMFLWFLRLFNVLGSEYDILISWVSAISLVLLGVFVGVLISGKTQVQVRGMAVGLFLVAVGFISAPFVVFLSVPFINTFPFTAETKAAIVGVLTVGYLGGYMAFLFWLKKKGILKPWETDSTETETRESL